MHYFNIEKNWQFKLKFSIETQGNKKQYLKIDNKQFGYLCFEWEKELSVWIIPLKQKKTKQNKFKKHAFYCSTSVFFILSNRNFFTQTLSSKAYCVCLKN